MDDTLPDHQETAKRIVTMPLSTLEGIAATMVGVKEEINSLKADLHTLASDVTREFKAVERRVNQQSMFQAWLTGAGAVIAVILFILVSVGSYHFAQWDAAYQSSQQNSMDNKNHAAAIESIAARVKALEEKSQTHH